MRTLPSRAVALLALCLAPSLAGAQTVGSVATASSSCDSSGVSGLSAQLVALQLCRMPGVFVTALPHPNLAATSSNVHGVMTQQGRDALWAASTHVSMQLNSMFRTLAEQYVLYHRSSCLTPAAPGTSNHESGRAVDVNNYSAAGVITAMTNAGCAHSFPTSDPVHFDCPGPNLASASVVTFQHLWNVNHPSDAIAEDGEYGPMTEARLAATPATGFANAGDCSSAPSCSAHCDGTVMVDAMCARGDCGAFGARCVDDSMGLRCVFSLCPDAGDADVCLPDGTAAHCHNGSLGTPTTCTEAQQCVSGHCVDNPTGDDAGTPPDDADPGGPDAQPPDDDASTPPDDDASSEGPDGNDPDAAGESPVDPPSETDAGPEGGASAIAQGGCGCRAAGAAGTGRSGVYAGVLLGFVTLRRRRRNARSLS